MGVHSLKLENERLDLLVRIARQDLQPHDITQLRAELLADLSTLEGLMQAALRRQLVSVVTHSLNRMGLIGVLPAGGGEPDNIIAQLSNTYEILEERRHAFTHALQDIIQHLNSAGIEPLILKGSISLIDGKPAWRFQRDIDFAINPDQADATVSALQRAGFRICDGTSSRPHHLRPMEREGLPGTIEPHIKLAGARAGSVLPDTMLLNSTVSKTWEGMHYKRLSNAGFLLHGFAHHHFQNRGYLYGTFSLKGLLEFADTLQTISADDVDEIIRITSQSRRLKTGLELWLALSETVLGCPRLEGFKVSDQARLQADKIANRHLAGNTRFPLCAALDQISLLDRTPPYLSFMADCIQTLGDTAHSAVWFDYYAQRHKASGVIEGI